ncbi:MAG: hypothetical protein MJZ82_01135 [Paludibacteraceae bacterium]|nr:hypothetical protein [Paludibacteraceae bacterium]
MNKYIRHILLCAIGAFVLPNLIAQEHYDIFDISFGASTGSFQSDCLAPVGLEFTAGNFSFEWSEIRTKGEINACLYGQFGINQTDKYNYFINLFGAKRIEQNQIRVKASWVWHLTIPANHWHLRIGPELTAEGLWQYMAPANHTNIWFIPYMHLYMAIGPTIKTDFHSHRFGIECQLSFPICLFGVFPQSNNLIGKSHYGQTRSYIIQQAIRPNTFAGIWNYINPILETSVSYRIYDSPPMSIDLYIKYTPNYVYYNLKDNIASYLSHNISLGCQFVFNNP